MRWRGKIRSKPGGRVGARFIRIARDFALGKVGHRPTFHRRWTHADPQSLPCLPSPRLPGGGVTCQSRNLRISAPCAICERHGACAWSRAWVLLIISPPAPLTSMGLPRPSGHRVHRGPQAASYLAGCLATRTGVSAVHFMAATSHASPQIRPILGVDLQLPPGYPFRRSCGVRPSRSSYVGVSMYAPSIGIAAAGTANLLLPCSLSTVSTCPPS